MILRIAAIVLTLAAAAWLVAGPADVLNLPRSIPRLNAHVVLVDPLAHPEVEDYRIYRDALAARDHVALTALTEDDDFLAYRTALTLGRSSWLTAAERLPHLLRADALRIDDALARVSTRAFHLEVARVAREAGDDVVAIEYFRAALPEPAAITALQELETDPYRLANHFLQARQYRRALEALDGLSAPSITAPAYRALGDHVNGLAAYEAWLEAEPGNAEALSGRAWSNFYLAYNDVADAQFAAIGTANAAYGRALLANRAGDIPRAVAFLRESGQAAHLWLATDLLEAREMYAEAVPVYLELAAGSSAYAGQAAFRAMVLAERLGDSETAATARALIRDGSWQDLVLGGTLQLPVAASPDSPEPAVLRRAELLARADDLDAARGELLFALRTAESPAETIVLAERLQVYGEFRHSRIAGQELLDGGSDDLRVWQLAYPRAYEDEVVASAEAFGVDPAMVWAVMRQESAFYPLAVSTSNAQGLMQVIPSTWDWLAELQREEPADAFDVSANIRYGAFYLNWLQNYLGGDLELVAASYNRGQGYIKRLLESDEVAGDKAELYRQIDAQETRNYLERVMHNYHVYRGLSSGSDTVAALTPPWGPAVSGY